MALMKPVMWSLLMLVAGCYCAPANVLDIGGTVGYDSTINGTIGGHLVAKPDGFSVSGTGKGIIGASWKPNVSASGHAAVGDKIAAGKGSFGADIDNNWKPEVKGEFGVNSKGEFVAGLEPNAVLTNKASVGPRVQIKTGDDARRLVGIPVADDEKKVGAPMLVPVVPNAYGAYNQGMAQPVPVPMYYYKQ